MQRCRDDIVLPISRVSLTEFSLPPISLSGPTFTRCSFSGPALTGPTIRRSGTC